MNVEDRQSVFEKHPKKTLTIVVFILIILLDIAAANFLFALGLYHPQYKIEKYYRVAHDVYHHSLAANISHSNAKWGPLGYRVNTNSLGFKDKAARQIPLETDRERLVIIGDSFTEGVGYAHQDTYVGIMENALAEKNVDVLNAGVSSYSTIVYWRKIKHLLEVEKLKFNQLLVMIDVSDIAEEALYYQLDDNLNVIDAPTAKANELDERFKRFITENTILLQNLRVFLRKLKKKNTSVKTIEDGLNVYRGMWTFDERAYNDYGKKGVALSTRHMDKLAALLKKHDIKLTVGVYPWPDHIMQKDLESRQVKLWQQWTKDNNANFVNLFPQFITAAKPRLVIEKYFIIGDVHWNKTGHQIVAQHLLAKLWNIQ